MILAVLGVAAALIDIIGVFPYIRDILRHKTKPERMSFWIFLLLNVITFSAQITDGFSWALALIGVSVFTSAVLAVLSVKYGYGRVKRRDFASILVALTGVTIWLTAHRPILAVAMVIVVDLAGFWLIIAKSWEAPQTETLVSWLAAAVATTLAAISVGKFDVIQITYVLYSAIGNWVLVILLVYRRRVIHTKQKQRSNRSHAV